MGAIGSEGRTARDRWTPRAGPGTVAASYLPCCAARLVALGAGSPRRGPDAADDARSRLALLWSERADALRYRRAVLRMTARSAQDRLALARLQREAFAYDAAAARLRTVRATRIPWLVRLLGARAGDRVVGATLGSMAAELAVLHLALRLGTVPVRING